MKYSIAALQLDTIAQRGWIFLQFEIMRNKLYVFIICKEVKSTKLCFGIYDVNVSQNKSILIKYRYLIKKLLFNCPPLELGNAGHCLFHKETLVNVNY